MIDFLSYVIGGLALGLLLYELVFKKGELFDTSDDWPKGTDCSEEDVPIVNPEDVFDQWS